MNKITLLFILISFSAFSRVHHVIGDTTVSTIEQLVFTKIHGIKVGHPNNTISTISKDANSFILEGIDQIEEVQLIDLNGRKVSFDVEPQGNTWSITPHHINTQKFSFILLITDNQGEFLSKRVDLF